MIDTRRKLSLAPRRARNIGAAIILAAAFASPAFADEEDASSAITRAQTKIETVSRVAGQASDGGDQSFTMARETLQSAEAAKKANKYDEAEMLAEQAGLLADLTTERAKLAALKTSHDDLLRTTAAVAPVAR
jgi:hypothetical protein